MNCVWSDEMNQEMIDKWHEFISMVESDQHYVSMVAIDQILFDERLRDSWYVPLKITRNHQVLNRKPLVSHIRNSIWEGSNELHCWTELHIHIRYKALFNYICNNNSSFNQNKNKNR